MPQLLLTILGLCYLLLIVFAFVYLFVTISSNKEEEPLREISNDYKQPLVSIIIPTFNEENNIGKCLRSIVELNYSKLEIIVSDGGSQDRTIEIAREYADKVIVDKTVPSGWIGKNWGCYLGYKNASGKYLLFIDADTVHKKNSLKHFMKIAIERDTALLSVFPYQIINKWWESINAVFYFANHLINGGVNSINNPKKMDSYSASGQFMLFKREDYEKFGGHEYIKGSIVEDYSLARVVKTKLNSLYYIDSSKLVTTRMYPESAKQCWNGWKKCLFPGTKLTKPKRITGALLWFLWGLAAPVAITLTAIYASWPYLLAAIFSYIACCQAFFFFWHPRGQHIWVTYVFLPIVIIMFCVLLAVSALELLIKKKTSWRGRVYKPNLYAGSRFENNYNLVGNTNRLAQLETDIEVELNDKILTDSEPTRLSKKRKNISVEKEPSYLLISDKTE